MLDQTKGDTDLKGVWLHYCSLVMATHYPSCS